MIESDVCFLPMIDSRSLYFVQLHSHYSKGNLLQGGGVGDQPSLYLDTMEYIENL